MEFNFKDVTDDAMELLNLSLIYIQDFHKKNKSLIILCESLKNIPRILCMAQREKERERNKT